MKRMNFPGRKDARRRDAEELHAASAARSLEQRLQLIEERPGVSARELARLLSPKGQRRVAEAAVVQDAASVNDGDAVPKKRKGNPKGKKGKKGIQE